MSSDSQLIPFVYSVDKNTQISTFEFYGDYVFAGVFNSGMVIRSKNRYSWEKYYQTDDTNVSSLKVNGGYLYIGTSPEGNVYRINLSTLSSEDFGSMGSEIVDFALFNQELYIAVNGPSAIMKLNVFTNKFDFVYTPYALINEMAVINNKIYLAMEAGNIITYDGISWVKILPDDISSYRNVSKDIYSHSNSSFISRTGIINSSGLSDEDAVNIFPLHYTSGIKRIAQDSTSIVMGASNFSRVYRFMDNKLDMIFDTEGTCIDSILNVGLGANLVAIENKVYLVYSGEINSSQTSIIGAESTNTTTTSTNPDADKVVVITYPDGGENIVAGDTVNIQWSTTLGINEAIKLELVSGSVVTAINDQTSNVGKYEWEVPLFTPESSNYKIRITRLTAGDINPEINVDESDGTFSIVKIATTTTTTTLSSNTTGTTGSEILDTSSTRGIPVLVLPEFESIVEMVFDSGIDGVLLSTSNGRILRCDMITINGFLTGNRLVYADVFDGCGYMGSAQTVFTYAMYKKLIELDENKVVKKWKYFQDITAIKTEKITAMFLGPVMNIRNDFGFWKELTWEETKPTGANITIFLRAAETEEQLLQQPWIYSTSSTTGEIGVITRSLNNVGLSGQYLQVKIEIEVNIKDVVPLVTNVTLKYSARNSSYFFTNNFSLDVDNPVQKGLITATISQPANTEIQFGVASENTSDWNEYQLITLNKTFTLNNKEMKIGIKFTSYDSSLPEVSEFAIITGGETLKVLNS